MKKLTITSKDINSKQWSDLLLELNLIKKAWSKYAKLDINAPNIKKILLSGNKKYDPKENK
tara:strand:- start:435 stop:617 length:183 start_codon:yes stop_codon:yes gene_type:complete